MALGQTVFTQRAILAVLAPLTGGRASGAVTVKSTTGGNVVLPRGAYAAPIIASPDTGNEQIARDKLFLTTAEVTVTPTGVPVAVSSLLGGVHHNLPNATKVRWDPELTGIEKVSVFSTAPTGGIAATGDAHVKRILVYEDLPTTKVYQAVFAAQHLGLAPTVLLSWVSSGQAERKGRNLWHRADRWVAHVVVERKDGTIERGHEGMNLLDIIEAYLGERGAVDGSNFSDPPVQIMGRSRHSVSPTSYVYAIAFQTHGAMSTIDLRTKGPGGTFKPWDRTKYDVKVASTPAYPLIENAVYDEAHVEPEEDP